MDNAIYITLSRQAALFRQMDSVANNLANVSTPGYNGKEMIFTQFLIDSGRNDKNAYTQDEATYNDFSKGPLTNTGRTLDAAIEGQGFFMVETPLGPRYTRRGNFAIDGKGFLVTAEGYPVLGNEGQRIEFSEEDNNIVITDNGIIRVGKNDERGRIGVVNFQNLQLMKRGGNGLYSTDEAATPVDESNYRLMQGMIEQSNVNAVKQMTEMVEVSRSVGSTSNLLNSLHDLVKKTVSTVSKP